jgi:nucleotide-binding universal stress UspA family protein
MFKHLLVPTDGSRLSEAALAQAIDLAKSLGARISVLHVVTNFMPDPAMDVPMLAATAGEAFQQRAIAEAESILGSAVRRARAHDVEVRTHYVFSGEPYRAIVDEAQSSQCDLIVMASHGRRGLEALLLGSETQKVLTHCQVPVLVVRA